ncbi:MAG: LruC domain-containing protein [Bacteroidaceae bacterium]|nr:LruC domain-containing protein [Bacteroidaceae bacterium]
MKKVFFKTMMGAGLVGMLSAGCVESPTDLYDPNYVIEQYKAKWEEQFGEVDPDHTWNMAKKVVADINLYGISDDECEVKVYTANPINSTSSLLAKGSVQGNKVVSFDVPSPLQYVFVTATNSRGALVNGYYKIVDGVITVGESVTRAEICPVTVGDQLEYGTYTYWDPSVGEHGSNVSLTQELYLLKGVEKKTTETWQYGDYIDLIGLYGVFAENTNNKEKYFDKLEVAGGVEYTMKEAGPVELTYIYGATANYNSFGYFYYSDESEIPTAKRYVLLEDARPRTSITVESDRIKIVDNSGSDLGLAHATADNYWTGTLYDHENKIALTPSVTVTVDEWGYETREEINPHFDDKVVGSTYKLTYFDENGNASYEFPAGMKIVFFIYEKKNVGTNLCNTIFYSRPAENARYGRKDQTMAVTYKYGENLILGFEDNLYGDNDMNDILFLVNGEFEEEKEIPQMNPNVPAAKEWIFACEDLGGVGDFDFNDIVFKVAYASGEATATVTPLAAGGTLEANIMFGSQSLGEIHELLGGSVGTMINTGLGATGEASSVEVQVGEAYSISNNFGGFSLQIVKEDGTTTVDITAPGQGEAPQMICVDAPWAWPKETVSIVKAYPDFGEWGANYANDGWTSNKVAGNVCE